MFFKERDARTAQALMTREAQLRERASHVALLVTQRRFEEADKLVRRLPLDKPSVEVAAELRALGDWHATKGRWQQAAERFSSLIKVHQLDDPEVTSVDQLRLAAAFLEAGDRTSYEQWRQSMLARFAPAVAPLPPSVMKACLLLPTGSNLLQPLAAASEVDTTSAAAIRPAARRGVAWSDAKVLFEYRCGDFADAAHERFLADSPPRLATFSLIQAMAGWQLKDYWGAMMSWTKGYALVQAGARQGLVTVTAKSEIFPGMREPDYLQAPWYDWAVADLLLREWDEMIAKADQSIIRVPGSAPSLEQVAIVRAAGEWHALRGEWNDALRCSQYCLQSSQADSLDHATMDYVNAAIACLEMGDDKTYLRLRGEMASRFKDPDERTADRVLGVGLMRPLDDQTAARLEPFAALLRSALQKQPTQNDTEFSIMLALLEFRRGNYINAMDRARQSVANVPGVALPNAMDSVIQAMSLHQLGNHSAARLELEHTKKLIETGFDLEFDMWHWRNWIFVRFLLREANALPPQGPPSELNTAPRNP
jgi:tetratricopeptide (TPR) repeat protein